MCPRSRFESLREMDFGDCTQRSRKDSDPPPSEAFDDITLIQLKKRAEALPDVSDAKADALTLLRLARALVKRQVVPADQMSAVKTRIRTILESVGL